MDCFSDFAQFIQSETLGELAQLITPIIAILISLLFGSGLWQYRKNDLLRMRKEYGTEGITLRRVFGSIIRKRYEQFNSELTQIFFKELHELLDAAGPPPEIEKCNLIEDYYDEEYYVWKDSKGTYSQRLMREFVLNVYPLDYQENKSKDDEKFDNARSRLGDFWERWTERFGPYTRFGPYPLEKRYAKERHCLLLLSWLDPAHRATTREDHQGKQSMYKLARRLHANRPTISPKNMSAEPVGAVDQGHSGPIENQ